MKVPSDSGAILVDSRRSGALVETRILDGEACGHGEGFDQCLVVAGEFGPSDLVGQIEVSVDLTAHLDGDTQKRDHWRVVGWKSKAVWMGAEIGQAQRARVNDEQPQDPLTGRTIADPHFLVRVEPDSDELSERGAVVVQH